MALDVVVGVLVPGVDPGHRLALGVELQPLHAEAMAQLQRRALDEVRHRLALLLVEVRTVLGAGLQHRLEPFLAARLVRVRRAHRIADGVVIGDGVFGLVLRVALGIPRVRLSAVLQQRGVEDRFLGKRETTEDEKGKVDFKERRAYTLVKKGELIARVVPEKEGSFGKTVKGELIPYKEAPIAQNKPLAS